jgi:hypothetical protein
MMARITARQDARTVRRALEQGIVSPNRSGERLLHGAAEEGDQHEDSPEPVDHARDRGEQLRREGRPGAASQRGASSVRKIASPTESGTAMSSASTDETTVP